MRSGNPALTKNAFAVRSSGEHMTIDGTVNRTFILLLILVVTGAYTWNLLLKSPLMVGVVMIASVIVGLIVGFVTIFKKEWAPVTAPIYAGVEGVVLGAASAIFESMYEGIVLQAVLLTIAVLFAMLMVYKSRLIKVTENFRLGVTAAMFGIFLIYLVSFILSFFGIGIPYIHDSGPIGIGFSVFVIIMASLNLVLDFDFIEKGAEQGAPKYLEWFGAFGLLVTLIWLYLEILRLLAKLMRN